ncbi:glycoside hydrolase family 18 protein [Aestuariibaculum sp. M13]|uniref:glycoside hydrolase family 18 protein n=1 Tax=Aestuariibaculum sp. M13 TaxID=2967132 RepID=UPI00215A095B|nr:glycoside hydrolase family 18 protein [Aestuariibaculum sp. M13]MCR8667592.1 glycoside hydrolase family 18 protein [Aestuariibaculum sp. M13]
MLQLNLINTTSKFIKSGVCLLMFSALLNCENKVEKEGKVEAPVENLKLIGYVAGYEDFDPSQVDAKKLTHINYAFANIVQGKPKFELAVDSSKIASLMALKSKKSDLKVLYSVGGWVWSDQFSHLAASESARQIFANGCVSLLKKHGFDGVDLDWEYPGQRGEDNAFRPSDKENFTLLLKTIREALEIQGKTDNKHYLLTIASGADQAYIDHTQLGKAQEYLDFINVMCYDYYHGWHYQTGHHANLNPSHAEKFEGNSGKQAIERHLKAGVPANKLVMGIPFYGRMWEKVNPQNNGLYQSAKSTGMIVPYWDIVEKIKSGHFKELYDESAKASYLWNAKDSVFISWETPKDIETKVQFIKENGLGGAMFWEYSLDNNQELLNALFKGME